MLYFKCFCRICRLKVVQDYNENSAYAIATYLEEYVQKCKDQEVQSLSKEEFFVPVNMDPNVQNFFKLFAEIPVLAKKYLAQHVTCKLYEFPLQLECLNYIGQ